MRYSRPQPLDDDVGSREQVLRCCRVTVISQVEGDVALATVQHLERTAAAGPITPRRLDSYDVRTEVRERMR